MKRLGYTLMVLPTSGTYQENLFESSHQHTRLLMKMAPNQRPRSAGYLLSNIIAARFATTLRVAWRQQGSSSKYVVNPQINNAQMCQRLVNKKHDCQKD